MTMTISTFCDFCNKEQKRQAQGYLEWADHEIAKRDYDWIDANEDDIMCVECQDERGENEK